MVNLDEVMQITRDNCDHNCKDCPLYLPDRKECYHTANEKWQEWNYKEHIRFGEYLRGNDGKANDLRQA